MIVAGSVSICSVVDEVVKLWVTLSVSVGSAASGGSFVVCSAVVAGGVVVCSVVGQAVLWRVTFSVSVC
jgi:hypothetical protein